MRHCKVREQDTSTSKKVYRVLGEVVFKSEYQRRVRDLNRVDKKGDLIEKSKREQASKEAGERDAAGEKRQSDAENAAAALQVVRTWQVQSRIDRINELAASAEMTADQMLGLLGYGSYRTLASILERSTDPDLDFDSLTSDLDALITEVEGFLMSGAVRRLTYQELVPVEYKLNRFEYMMPVVMFFFNIFAIIVHTGLRLGLFMAVSTIILKFMLTPLEERWAAMDEKYGTVKSNPNPVFTMVNLFQFVFLFLWPSAKFAYNTTTTYYKYIVVYIKLWARTQRVRVSHYFTISVRSEVCDNFDQTVLPSVMQYIRTDKRNISFRAAKGLARSLPAFVNHEAAYELQGELETLWQMKAAVIAQTGAPAMSFKIRGSTTQIWSRAANSLMSALGTAIYPGVNRPWLEIDPNLPRAGPVPMSPTQCRRYFQSTVPYMGGRIIDLTYTSWMLTHPRFLNFHYSFSDVDRFLRESFNTNGSVMGNYDHPAALGLFQASRIWCLVNWLQERSIFSGQPAVNQDWGY